MKPHIVIRTDSLGKLYAVIYKERPSKLGYSPYTLPANRWTSPTLYTMGSLMYYLGTVFNNPDHWVNE